MSGDEFDATAFPIPPRPWGIEEHETYLRVGSLAENGTIDETVFTISLEGANLLTELARARFIIDAVNKHRAK
jgi:hypothetical protein